MTDRAPRESPLLAGLSLASASGAGPANRSGRRSVGTGMRARALIFLAVVAPFFLAGCGNGKY